MPGKQSHEGEIRELREELDWLRHELDLIWHHVSGEVGLACKEDVISALEQELRIDEWTGVLIDGEAPADEIICSAIGGTLRTVRDRAAGVTAADVACWLGGELATRRGVRAVAECLSQGCARGLLVTVPRARPARYRRTSDVHGLDNETGR